MSQNGNRGRNRGAKKQTVSRGAGRKPKLDPSRGTKRGKSKLTSDDRRAAARSVFAKSSSSTGVRKGDETVDRGRRLQQVLAAAGYGSRRLCEELILDGRVEVDGKIVTELGVRVFPGEQKIRVDGEALPKARPVYVALNKPKNTLCTNHDPSGRRRVVDFIPERFGRLFPVGRLDQNSEGLILLTNDGALAERLTHPRYEAPKKYRVQVAGLVDRELVDALKRGVHIAEGVVQADDVVVRSSHKLSSILDITLTEGKNREIRRMLARVGHKVMQLQRVQVGSIKLGKLAPGEFRVLTSREVAELYRMADARPDDRTLDVDKLPVSLRRRPLEVSEIEQREAEKEASREAGKEKKRDGKPRKNDPNFHDEVKKQLKRRFEDDYSDRRRAPRDEFREEFRSKERSDERRRVRQKFDDEERTIGAKKFDREDDASTSARLF
ncbi:MAG: pseudouridine synthase, partial [Thermoguttaceae bacterium]|nr:pseudouridine synthase [Thermoguttaceae bacterium]